MTLVIEVISATDTYQLRHQVLRPNQTLKDCKYPLDFEELSLHLGAFVNNKLISVGSFYYERNDAFSDNDQYRLRGMATNPEYRSLGAGSKIMQHAIDNLGERNSDVLWCNARITVSDFYKKLGMKEHGEVFEIEPIGPHKLMYVRFK